jgi:hypothetical protein
MINKKDLQLPSLRIIGNLAASSKKIVERLQSENVIKLVVDLLEVSTENNVKMELLWILENLSNSSVDVINTLISLQKLNSLLKEISESVQEYNYRAKICVLNIFYNYAKNGNIFTIKKMIESEIFEYICKELDFGENVNIKHGKFLVLCLGVINKIISLSYRENHNDNQLQITIFNIIYKYNLKEKFENLVIDSQYNKSFIGEQLKIKELVQMALNRINSFEFKEIENDNDIF